MEHDTVESERKDLRAGGWRLVDLVAYQRDAVVSRMVIDKKTGSVTMFAFDKGQGLSEHKTPFEALVCVLDGEVDITISGKSHKLGQGEAIVMPANEPHALKGPGRFKMMLTMIRS